MQASGELLHRAEEALMKLTSRGYRQIPLELVVESEALEPSETPLAEVDEHILKKKYLQELQILLWQSNEAKDTSVKVDLSEDQLLETRITHEKNTRRKRKEDRTLPQDYLAVHYQAHQFHLAVKTPCL